MTGVSDFLAYSLARSPHRTCVIEAERTFTFEEVDLRARRLAEALSSRGLHRNDRIGMLACNRAEHLEIALACQRLGLIFVPMNNRLGLAEFGKVMADCSPSLIIGESRFCSDKSQLDHAHCWLLDDDGERSYEAILGRSGAPAVSHESCDPDALFEILYTSGTSGVAKGVTVTNRQHLTRTASIILSLDITADDIFLQTLPLFHLASTFTEAFAMKGGANILLRRHDVEEMARLARAHRPSFCLTIPTIMRDMLDSPVAQDFACLRDLLYGGAPLPTKLREELLARYTDTAFHQMYGMTEAGPTTLLRPEDHFTHRASGAGHPMMFQSLSIREPAGEQIVPQGETGEIVISGPNLTHAYWNRAPQADKLRPEGIRSGDMGYIDEEGVLFVTGRLSNMIISGGENVVAEAVEEVLYAQGSVRECAVIGVPDDRLGERIHAIIAFKHGEPEQIDLLDAYCRSHLAGYQRPRSYEVLPELPRNATGKIARSVLTDQRQPGGSPA